MIINLFIVWFLTGIWHGASWNFVIWGLYFGILIYIEKKFLIKILNKLPKFLSHIYLLLIVIIGWTIFYFADISDVFKYLQILFGFSNNEFTNTSIDLVITNNIYWILIAIIFSTPIAKIFNNILNDLTESYVVDLFTIFTNVIVIITTTSMLINNSYNPFLYFRF
ncbi:MAG: hypothetical protein ACRDD7_15455 [Peptostreptococcaceae bacterium]